MYVCVYNVRAHVRGRVRFIGKHTIRTHNKHASKISPVVAHQTHDTNIRVSVVRRPEQSLGLLITAPRYDLACRTYNGHARSYASPKHQSNHHPIIRSTFRQNQRTPDHAHTKSMHVRKCPLLYLSHPGTGANAFPLPFLTLPHTTALQGWLEEVLTARLHYGDCSITTKWTAREREHHYIYRILYILCYAQCCCCLAASVRIWNARMLMTRHAYPTHKHTHTQKSWERTRHRQCYRRRSRVVFFGIASASHASHDERHFDLPRACLL